MDTERSAATLRDLTIASSSGKYDGAWNVELVTETGRAFRGSGLTIGEAERQAVSRLMRRIVFVTALALEIAGCGEAHGPSCPTPDAGPSSDASAPRTTVGELHSFTACLVVSTAYYEPATGGVHRCSVLPPAEDLPPECPWISGIDVYCDTGEIERCVRSLAAANTCEQWLEAHAACDPDACR